mmetsp:Transcript_31758/g.84550  ORF Transcript_31758/g.84550 Transcript_31758/m.84550 type:complete len:114 (-) Transcript_31758:203-544(-)
MKNKRGKIVSKRGAAAGKRKYTKIEEWVECLVEARKALHITGFVAVNGRTLQGKALYVKTKALRAARGSASAASSGVAEPGTPARRTSVAAAAAGLSAQRRSSGMAVAPSPRG